MASRLYALNGALPHVLSALDRGWREFCSALAEIGTGIAFTVPFVALVGVIPWSCGHDQRLRERIAREGCPYNAGADLRDLPGAREREFHAQYCDD